MEDRVPDTPVRQAKDARPSSLLPPLDSEPYVIRSGSEEEDEEGDGEGEDEDEDEDPETIATIPLHAYHPPLRTAIGAATQVLTQPTQIIERPPHNPPSNSLLPSSSPPPAALTPQRSPAVVQVATSSPLAATTTAAPPNRPSIFARPGFAARRIGGGFLASAMAPAGTQFRPPAPAPHPPPLRGNRLAVVEDDGPTYRGGSSDEDDISIVERTDIKPSTFTKTVPRNAQPMDKEKDKDRVAESPVAARGNGYGNFKEITAAAFYRPAGGNNGSAEKRKADGLIAGTSSTPASNTAPPYKKPRSGYNHKVDHSSFLATIGDYSTREKLRRILGIFPDKDPEQCYKALLVKRGVYLDALDYLAELDDDKELEEADGDSTHHNPSSEDELSFDQKAAVKAPPRLPPPTKQHIKARSRIQERWTASQQARDAPPNRLATVKPTGRRLVRGQRARPDPFPASTSTTTPTAPTSRPAKLGRLIRGRKTRSPTRSESPVLNVIESDTSDADDDLRSEDDGVLQAKVLDFFNSCSADDLADIAEIIPDLANILISHRPFPSLATVREVKQHDTNTKGGAKNRGSSKKTLGDKVVDKCLDMWVGYEAVDALVTKCESLGRPIAEEMKQWGVDVFGCKKQGELELVSLEQMAAAAEKPHDSGIGTPSSHRSSSEEITTSRQKPSSSSSFISQPAIMSESITLKNYQVVGLNWLNLIFEQKLSCILADDMGLGKTCQVISFLAHLLERGITGPHLVVVPSSTLENWLREFSVFCPKLRVMPYYADQATRAHIREQIEKEKDDINVVITTYTIAKAKVDSVFLRNMNFCACVYDEGHMLKSSKSLLYEKLIRIPARFRLLLTGTPLQNNLQELASLLGFILPSVFRERKDDLESIFSAKAKTVDDTHSTLLSAQRIARAKSMLTPFVLRRKKHQVIDLPPKINRVEYCTMIEAQAEIYQAQIETVKQLIADRAAGKRVPNKSSNILMKLRQAAIHPLFYRRIYDEVRLSRLAKACLKEEQWAQSDPDQIYVELKEYNDFEVHCLCARNPNSLGEFALQNEEWMQSGKVEKLCELLKQYTENGDRILLFSQFTMVMDILEYVLTTLGIRFFRLDGTTSVEDRQSTLDAFYEQVDIPVFMLSTKAGGAGINLACANKVIIFDSSFNPQEDVQAENRAHRVGQTREVEVVRLITRDTIEEQIYALGQTKLALDQRVVGDDEGGGSGGARASKKNEEVGLKAVEEMMIAKLEQQEATTLDLAGSK